MLMTRLTFENLKMLQFSNVGPPSSAPGCALIIPGLPKTRSTIFLFIIFTFLFG